MADRLQFGKIEEVIEPQTSSRFRAAPTRSLMQKDIPAGERTDSGLQAVFREVFLIKSYDEAIELDLVT